MALQDGRRGPPPDKVVVVGRGGRRDVGVVDDDDGDDDDEAGSGKGAGSDNDDDKVATAVLRRAGGQNGNQASAVVRKMERGISRATDNEVIVNKARDRVEQNFSAAMRISDSPDSRGFTGAKPNGPQVGGPGRLPEEDDDVEDVPFAAGAGPAASAGPARRKTALSTTTTTAKAKAVGFTAARGKPSTASATSGFIETPTFTFTLPDLTCYQDDFKAFLEKDLIEMSSLVSLEQSGRLNWWAETDACQKLWPLATTGDGNCLLHAASLGMWGFHDRLLTLRKALHAFMSSSESSAAIYRRWRWQSHLQNTQYGLMLSEAEWDEEWQTVLRLASSEPRTSSSSSSSSSTTSSSSSAQNNDGPPGPSARRRSRLSIAAMSFSGGLDKGNLAAAAAIGGGLSSSPPSGPAIVDLHHHHQDSSPSSDTVANAMYESLEEVHVLALAHVLQRPIIVVADTILRDINGEALAPIPFGGIYLPFECPPTECQTNPLLLTYNTGHFSALVTMQNNSEPPVPQAVIPVTDSDHSLLPLHFAVDPGPEFTWNHDELDPSLTKSLMLPQEEEAELHLNMLSSYLELVRVPLPDWLVPSASSSCQHEVPPALPTSSSSSSSVQSPPPLIPTPDQHQIAEPPASMAPPRSNPDGAFNNQGVRIYDSGRQYKHYGEQQSSVGYIVDVDQTDGYRGGCRATSSKTTKQIQSVAKQFGSIGKKLKKNLGQISKLARSSSFKKQASRSSSSSGRQDRSNPSLNHNDQMLQQQQRGRKLHVSGCQAFILGAFIHTNNRMLPYQNEMVENYLQEAFRRFERDKEAKEKLRQDQIEQAEKRQREIYLNGGFVDCVNSGCPGQGTSETSYLCKPCFAEQKAMRKQQKEEQQQQQQQNYVDSRQKQQQQDQQQGAKPAKSTFFVVEPVSSHPPPSGRRRKQSGGFDQYQNPRRDNADRFLQGPSTTGQSLMTANNGQQGASQDLPPHRRQQQYDEFDATSDVVPLQGTQGQCYQQHHEQYQQPLQQQHKRERFQQGSQSEMSQMRQQHHQLVDYRQPGRGYRLDEVTTAMMVELPPVSNSDSSAVVHRNQDSSSTSSSSKFVRSMCRNGDCEFYGTPEFDFFCSKCFSRLTSSQKGNHVDGSTSKKNRGSGGNGYIVAPGSSSANNSEVATSR